MYGVAIGELDNAVVMIRAAVNCWLTLSTNGCGHEERHPEKRKKEG